MKVINIADHQGRKAAPPKPRTKPPRGEPLFVRSLRTAEEKAAHAELLARLTGELRPVGFMEQQLVELVCDSEYRSARMIRLEQALRGQQQAGQTVPLKTLEAYVRHQAHLEKTAARARVELARHQKRRKRTQISKVD